MNRLATAYLSLLMSLAVLLFISGTVRAQSMGVVVQENNADIILNNGLIQLTFSKPQARITSLIDEMGGATSGIAEHLHWHVF